MAWGNDRLGQRVVRSQITNNQLDNQQDQQQDKSIPGGGAGGERCRLERGAWRPVAAQAEESCEWSRNSCGGFIVI